MDLLRDCAGRARPTRRRACDARAGSMCAFFVWSETRHLGGLSGSFHTQSPTRGLTIDRLFFDRKSEKRLRARVLSSRSSPRIREPISNRSPKFKSATLFQIEILFAGRCVRAVAGGAASGSTARATRRCARRSAPRCRCRRTTPSPPPDRTESTSSPPEGSCGRRQSPD